MPDEILVLLLQLLQTSGVLVQLLLQHGEVPRVMGVVEEVLNCLFLRRDRVLELVDFYGFALLILVQFFD